MVVPVHNPGRYLEDLVDSLLTQSLPPGEFEAVFVDDGSTDESPARLDALAAEHPHFRVFHEKASGWSGRPRNVGIDNALGEYVQFADHDDKLAPEALERLYAYAVANDADIVVGKMAGQGRGVPRQLFRENRPDATLADSALIDSLTPHKMFRREFLLRKGLYFPEEPRRLEDHVFVVQAYFLARRISVLSDYTCYIHTARDDAGNAGFRRYEPASYFANLCEALDIVEHHTEPGPLRDRLYRRWLRVEMLERLRGNRLLKAPADWRSDFFREVHRVTTERFGPGVAAGLPALHRAVAAAVADGDFDRLLALAHWEAGVDARASATSAGRSGAPAPGGAGGLRLTVRAELTSGRRPMAFVADDDGVDRLAPPAATRTPADVLDVTAQLRAAKIEVVARDQQTGSERYLPVESTTDRAPGSAERAFRLRFTARVQVPVETETAPGDGPLRTELLIARVTCCGWTRQVRLDVALRTERDGTPVLVAAPRAPLWRRVGGAVKRRVVKLRKRAAR
ncbi:hypothetical protein BIV57_21410 [Mangrovactinospora gilvigrisea]|uniref:Glycosyltransferase 2-like domain-containing protein n=1 Tax=Mangrovactinospora gilvigrisea TaxID=1428644 RepID=A0A1J7C1M0_9ACTN|nr:hypothetical protein BIV57_21410 [Mangrovactinospora gilvigrisea]